MLVSMNWIKDYVDLSGLDLTELIRRFTLSTAEVEDIIYKGSDTNKVIAAKIVSVENHPSSQKLHLLKIDTGSGIVDCVCGAPNVRPDMTVAFARAGGAVCGNAINEATVAGFKSCGMCCSEAELGISGDSSGLMELSGDIALGTDIKDIFCIEDIIFEVDNKSLTNRPDLWGHYGIAREFSALSERPLKPVEKTDSNEYSSLPAVDIKISDTENCYRYSGIKVKNIKQKKSPKNMQIRLYYCGMRPINLLADLTNYLMLELGQPMHAFDLKKVDSIDVKRFDEPFTFTTLDNQERSINSSNLMITSKNVPVAIAGVMGGLDSGIDDDTDSLLLESANFDAVSVRKTSTALGLRTDASMRYEKTLDPELTLTAAERFIKLLKDIDGGAEVISSLTDCYARHYDTINISFSKAYVDRYTGIDIACEKIVKTLSSLGFNVNQSGDKFDVTVPSHRATKDVTIAADIIEEITRIYGYDNFAIATTNSRLSPVRLSMNKSTEYAVKDLLVSKFDLHEVHSYLWADSKKLKALGIEEEKNVRVLNAMTADNETLKNSIIPNLLVFASENKGYAPEYGMFEISRVVDGLNADGLCNEVKKLGILLCSKTTDEGALYLKVRDIAAYIGRDVKHGVFSFVKSNTVMHSFQHPMNTADILYNGINIGYLCVVHPTVKNKIDKKAGIAVAELNMDILSANANGEIKYKEPSKYPGIDIDLSFITNGMSYAQMEVAWEDGAENYLDATKIVDIYKGEQSSIAVRFSFVSHEKTLQRGEIDSYINIILSRLSEKGVVLKS